jgi:hypothetical protein
MLAIIHPARFPVGGVPAVAVLTNAAAPTYKRGEPVVSTAGLIVVCGADPLLIKGFALQNAQTNPGYDAANSPATFTGRQNTGSVALANDATEFSAQLTNGSSTVVAPTVAADQDSEYGLTEYSDVWYVDQAKIGIDARNNRVYFKVLPAYRQS